MGRPHLMWMDIAMHDMDSLSCSLGHTLQIALTRDWAHPCTGMRGVGWSAGA